MIVRISFFSSTEKKWITEGLPFGTEKTSIEKKRKEDMKSKVLIICLNWCLKLTERVSGAFAKRTPALRGFSLEVGFPSKSMFTFGFICNLCYYWL